MDIKSIIDNSINIYRHGSLVYGTFVPGISDYDHIVILPDSYAYMDTSQYEEENNQYTFYTQSTWQKMLDNNEVSAIESYLLPPEHILKETIKFSTTLNTSKIRDQFSKTASNSYVKCKKKLEVEDSFNPYVGKKSLWHSLRILDFGIQILKYGKIIDYTSVSYLYKELISNESISWEYYRNMYKPLYNNLKTQFKLMEKESVLHL